MELRSSTAVSIPTASPSPRHEHSLKPRSESETYSRGGVRCIAAQTPCHSPMPKACIHSTRDNGPGSWLILGRFSRVIPHLEPSAGIEKERDSERDLPHEIRREYLTSRRCHSTIVSSYKLSCKAAWLKPETSYICIYVYVLPLNSSHPLTILCQLMYLTDTDSSRTLLPCTQRHRRVRASGPYPADPTCHVLPTYRNPRKGEP